MDRDDIRNGCWYVEFDSITVSRAYMRMLREHAEHGLWREVIELPSTTSPIMRGLYVPLRAADV